MCDIYPHQCEGNCGKAFDTHLGGWDTGREEIEVWCDACWPKLPRTNWTRFRINEDPKRYVTFVYLTDNAVRNREDNIPNYFDFQVVTET